MGHRAVRAAATMLLAAGWSAVAVAPPAAAKLVFPNDPLFSAQWDAFNTGQTILGTPGKPGLDGHLAEAWSITHGSAGVKVAVVDTGIDYQLPELAPNVDVAAGANFDAPGSPPLDTIGHGTAMAGIIGALGNNGSGLTGVDWRVSLIAEKVTVDRPVAGGEQQIAAAIHDAVGKGARVVNLSLGSAAPHPHVDAEMDAAPQTLFVTSAGNDARNLNAVPQYPCQTSPGDPPVSNRVCVAAVDNRGALDLESNYSAQAVDLAAPGTDVPQLTLPGVRGGFANGHGYEYGSGTSEAAAFVSGVAALLLAHDTSLTGSALRSRLLATVDAVPDLAGKVASGGVVDAGRALGVAPGPRPHRDPHDPLLGRSAKALVHAPSTSRCVSTATVSLRVRDAGGVQVETVTITVAGKAGKPIFPPDNERPIKLRLPARRRVPISITILDTASRPYYLTLSYRRC